MKTIILGVLAAAGASLASGNDFSSSEEFTGVIDYPVLQLWHHEATAQAKTDASKVTEHQGSSAELNKSAASAAPSSAATSTGVVSDDQKKATAVGQDS